MRYLTIIIVLLLTSACSKEDPEAKYLQLMSSANQYMQEEKLDEARIELQNAIEIKPKSSEAYFKLAQILVSKGKIPRAVENYTSAVNYDPNNREARVHLASIMVAAKQFELAESHISALLEKNPADTEALILKANIEGMGPRKNNKKAIEILEKVRAREPNNSVVLASIASYELNLENPEKAEKLYRQALSITDDNSAIKMALADLLNSQGRLDEAQELIENLVEANPDASSLRYMLGEFLLRRGLGSQAVEQYQKTLEQDGENFNARDRLYDFYVSRKELDKAKALTQDLKSNFPKSLGSKYFEGRDLELEGKTDEAYKSFSEGLNLLGNFPPTFRRLGTIEYRQGKLGQAIEHLTQTLSLDKTDVSARYLLARSYFGKGETAQAARHLDEILSRFPRHLGANILRADISVLNDEPEDAERVYSQLVKSYPENPIGYFKTAVMEETKGNKDRAAEWYKKAIAFDNDVLPSSRRLISIRTRQEVPVEEIINELKELKSESKNSQAEFNLLIGTLTMANPKQENHLKVAREYLLKAVEGNPKLVGAYFALGAIDAIGGDLEASATNYNKLLEKNPKHITTLMLLALTREKQGKLDDAKRVYNKALEVSPRFAPAANNLAWILAEEKGRTDFNRAMELAEMAKEEMPNEPSISDTLGWVFVKQGNPERAVPYLEHAVSDYKKGNPEAPINPEIHYHLAKALSMTNQKDKAKVYLEKAIAVAGEKHPKAVDMKKLLGSL